MNVSNSAMFVAAASQLPGNKSKSEDYEDFKKFKKGPSWKRLKRVEKEVDSRGAFSFLALAVLVSFLITLSALGMPPHHRTDDADKKTEKSNCAFYIALAALASIASSVPYTFCCKRSNRIGKLKEKLIERAKSRGAAERVKRAQEATKIFSATAPNAQVPFVLTR